MGPDTHEVRDKEARLLRPHLKAQQCRENIEDLKGDKYGERRGREAPAQLLRDEKRHGGLKLLFRPPLGVVQVGFG